MTTSIDAKTLTEDELQFIEDYKNLTYVELSHKYDVCEQTINKWRQNYGLTKKKGRKSTKPCFKNKEE